MIVAKAPYRISLFGGGTDFPEYFQDNEGYTIGGPIDKYVYVTCNTLSRELQQTAFRFVYRNFEDVTRLDQIRHPVLRAVMTKYPGLQNLEIHTIANFPASTGLGGSSSFTVALLRAIAGYRNDSRSDEDIAMEAIEIERIRLKEKGGWQDQIYAAHGKFGRLRFSKSTYNFEQRYSTKTMQMLSARCFLYFTGYTRSASELESSKIEALNKNILCYHRLRDLTFAADALLLSGSGQRLDEIGELLLEGWKLKRETSTQVTTPEIDEHAQNLLKNGATGVKLLGAGAGGYILAFVPELNLRKFEGAGLYTKCQKVNFINCEQKVFSI